MKKIKKISCHFIEHPILSSILLNDAAILLFYRPPAIISLLMLGTLIALSMFFGEKLALFSDKKPGTTEA